MKRAFLLVDAMHGLKRSDEDVLMLFRQYGVPHQVILSKVDRVLYPKLKNLSVSNIQKQIKENASALEEIVSWLRGQIQPGLGDGPEALGEIISCSAETPYRGSAFGINDLRWAILSATGLQNERMKAQTFTTADFEAPLELGTSKMKPPEVVIPEKVEGDTSHRFPWQIPP